MGSQINIILIGDNFISPAGCVGQSSRKLDHIKINFQLAYDEINDQQ